MLGVPDFCKRRKVIVTEREKVIVTEREIVRKRQTKRGSMSERTSFREIELEREKASKRERES